MDKILNELYISSQENEDLAMQFTILKEYLSMINISKGFELPDIMRICQVLGLDALARDIKIYLKQKNEIEKERSSTLIY